MSVPYGEAVFFGMWYFTILTLSIAVWIIAIQTIKMRDQLEGIRTWLSHYAIEQAARGVPPNELVPRRTPRES